ncbi:MAG: hypothetical protein KGH60_03795 [Candidatus Micrarchaeota archaeon]|nr:hypothetical protein [Candidatus Micrarchaeota archaeon]
MGTILCFGDSITFGEGYNGGWCGYLKRWFEDMEEGNQVYNLGIPGQTSSELLARFEAETKARLRFKRSADSYTTIIAIGVNDAKYNGSISGQNALVSEDAFRSNALGLMREAKSFKQKVAFIGLAPVDESKTLVPSDVGTVLANERVARFNEIITECCKKDGLPFLDLNKIMLKRDYKMLLEDGLHPNAKGHRFIFTRVRAFMKKNDLLP